MKDITKQPGYLFHNVRLLKAYYQLMHPNPLPINIETKFDYGDELRIDGNILYVQQSGKIVISTKDSPPKDILSLEIVIEGTFEAIPPVNISLDEFGKRHAIAILFPYLREFISRFTSNMGNIPSIVLPPFNVLAMKESRSAEQKQI